MSISSVPCGSSTSFVKGSPLSRKGEYALSPFPSRRLTATWAIPAFDLRPVPSRKPFYVVVVSGKGITSSSRVQGVTAQETLLPRVIEILPAAQPGNRCRGDIVREAGLTEQLRQVAVSRGAIRVVAKVSAQLATGVRDACRPLPGAGIEHDLCRVTGLSRPHLLRHLARLHSRRQP